MIYLLNSLPNALLVPRAGEKRTIEGITANEAREILAGGFVSAVGHQSTADVLTKKLGLKVEFNRIQLQPQKGDVLVVGAFSPPRRLAEGEFFSEKEILRCPIGFCKIIF
jgi:hypothetical protein